ncbi:MAG: hypothetical protein II852_16180 [Bacteroidales bacterium]|nr:hypothetical protein [Bacteroidales bacterium]
MNKYFVKIAVVLFLVAFAMSACDKDVGTDDSIVENNGTESPLVVTHGYVSQPAVIDGKKYEWTFERKNSLSKSFYFDWTDSDMDDMFSTAKEDPTSRTYKVMKVWRKSQPGKYFWIMIENFKFNMGDSSYVYNNVDTNAEVYGRMYHWEIANQCASLVRMNLKRIDANGNEFGPKIPTPGRLPTTQDLCDLMEQNYVDKYVNSFNPYTDWGYYDVFLSGREFYNGLYAPAAYPTMGGWMDNTDYGYQYYDYLHQEVNFWTSDWYLVESAHYPLRIMYQNGLYHAFLNAPSANHYGMYVRYVFEPIQVQ